MSRFFVAYFATYRYSYVYEMYVIIVMNVQCDSCLFVMSLGFPFLMIGDPERLSGQRCSCYLPLSVD
jgi:hypothetical protein